MVAVITINRIRIGRGEPMALIAGPCSLECRALALKVGDFLFQLTKRLGIPLIYKGSYDKANRTSSSAFRGPGLNQGLSILQEIKQTFSIPVTTDVHETMAVEQAASVCDLLQIPAFLCRQTDLLHTAACSKKPVNIKKGQFMSPWGMKHATHKITSKGNPNVMITERGSCFGYDHLIVDLRSIPIMQNFSPVCFDATHSVQKPAGEKSSSGGDRKYVALLTNAAIAAGCNALFLECHPDPKNAKCDKETQIDFAFLETYLPAWLETYKTVQKQNMSGSDST